MSQDIPDTMSRDIPDRISSGVTTGSEGAGVSKARLVITAVTLEKRPVAEVAATYGVARSWIYELLTRYRDEGEAAFEPRSKAPKTSPGATPAETAELVLRLRQQLHEAGHDAGAATVHRILTRAGAITPEPKKRPSRPTSGSRPRCRTRPGSPTSPTTRSPTQW